MATGTAAKRTDNPFFRKVEAAKQRVLLVDYDGAIAPSSSDQHGAFPYAGILKRLQIVLTECRTRLIIVSRRAAGEIPGLLGIHPEIWGTHGLERIRPDGHCQEVHANDNAFLILAQAENRLEEEGLGEYIEFKLAGVAVHWKNLAAGEAMRVRRMAAAVFEPFAARKGLAVAEFEEGFELRLVRANKGYSLRSMLRELNHATAVAYLGNDDTDEDAFRVLGNRGLSVLVSPELRPSAAHIWLKPPQEVVEFLDQWICACQGGL